MPMLFAGAARGGPMRRMLRQASFFCFAVLTAHVIGSYLCFLINYLHIACDIASASGMSVSSAVRLAWSEPLIRRDFVWAPISVFDRLHFWTRFAGTAWSVTAWLSYLLPACLTMFLFYRRPARPRRRRR